MFHTQISGTIVVFSENLTFEAHIDFRVTVPLRVAIVVEHYSGILLRCSNALRYAGIGSWGSDNSQ